MADAAYGWCAASPLVTLQGGKHFSSRDPNFFKPFKFIPPKNSAVIKTCLVHRFAFGYNNRVLSPGKWLKLIASGFAIVSVESEEVTVTVHCSQSDSLKRHTTVVQLFFCYVGH